MSVLLCMRVFLLYIPCGKNVGENNSVFRAHKHIWVYMEDFPLFWRFFFTSSFFFNSMELANNRFIDYACAVCYVYDVSVHSAIWKFYMKIDIHFVVTATIYIFMHNDFPSTTCCYICLYYVVWKIKIENFCNIYRIPSL